MGEFAAKPTTQLADQRPSAPTISVVILQILINIISLEPGRFSVQKARMNNQLREFITANQMLQGRKTMFGTQVIQGVPVGGVGGFCANNQGGRGLK